MSEAWHRYENGYICGGRIRHLEFEVLRKTAKGVWLKAGVFRDDEKFVLNDAKKRYAYPTKELALESFIFRKRSQIKILEAQLNSAKDSLHEAMEMQKGGAG